MKIYVQGYPNTDRISSLSHLVKRPHHLLSPSSREKRTAKLSFYMLRCLWDALTTAWEGPMAWHSPLATWRAVPKEVDGEVRKWIY